MYKNIHKPLEIQNISSSEPEIIFYSQQRSFYRCVLKP